jgi:radical SAM superfamily enzyme YgiQ (UPF0313 family)
MKTKIALVSVVSPMYDSPSFNLGLAELAGYLRHKNPELNEEGAIRFIEPDIVLSGTDGLKTSNHYTIDILKDLEPPIIGLSAKLGSHDKLYYLLKRVTKFSWNPTIVVGNVVSTFSHDKFIKEFPYVYFCLGDGELAMDAIYNDRALADTPNIAIYTGQQVIKTRREVLNTREQYWLPALDMLPTAIKHGADMAMRATTGCSSSCTFCSIPHTAVHCGGKKAGWRPYPIERTCNTLKELAKHGIKKTYFVDDEFGNVDWSFLESLGQALVAMNNKIKINVSMRLDAFWTKDMTKEEQNKRLKTLRLLKKGGLESLFLGAESGCNSQLKRYGKGITTDTIINALSILSDEGITINLGWIPIDPLVTEQEYRENMEFLMTRIGSKYVYDFVSSPITTMRVQRGTAFGSKVGKKNLITGLQDNMSFYDCNFDDPKMKTLSDATRKWFQDVMDTRYRFRQFARLNPEKSYATLAYMHKLDISFSLSYLDMLNDKDFNDNSKAMVIGYYEKQREIVVKKMEKIMKNHNKPSTYQKVLKIIKKALKFF